MSVQDTSLKQRKKKESSRGILKGNGQESKPSQSNFGTSKLSTYGLYVVYIMVFLAVISCLSWVILCKALCKELSLCNAEFLSSFTRNEGSLNVSKTSSTLPSKPRVPKDDTSLWVIERRSNLSLDEFIEKYDGKRLAVCFGDHWSITGLFLSHLFCISSCLVLFSTITGPLGRTV